MAGGAILLALPLLATGGSDRPPASGEVGPEARAHHQLVFHEERGEVLLLGGSTRTTDGYRYFDDVWARDARGWRRAGSMPFRRSSHRAVYDPDRASVVLFGGIDGGTAEVGGVLWTWSASGWSRRADAAGDADVGRAEPGMCFDRARGRVVLFGGWTRSGGPMSGTTWEWDGRELRAVSQSGPEARAGHALVFDPVRGACLLFGGRGASGLHGDTWTWTGREWKRLDVEGPGPRWFFGAASDRRGERVVLFGGTGPDGQDLGDTWAWDGTSWRRIAGSGPPARGMPRMAFDGSAVVLFGGRSRGEEGFIDRKDTWVLEGDEWRRATP